MESLRGAFALNSTHTLAVIRAVPDADWDRPPGGSASPLRPQLLHLALVRESICRQVAQVPTEGLGATLETPDWIQGATAALAAAFEAHLARCEALLDRMDLTQLDAPFTTRFGNRSTARNLLRCMGVEEVHHRAQMTFTLRLFGIEPPPFPGQAWVELGISQD